MTSNNATLFPRFFDPEVIGDNGCIPVWSGVGYIEFSTCMEDLLPYYALVWTGVYLPGSSMQIFKDWLGWLAEFPYKNLGQCIADQEILLGESPIGLCTGDFENCDGLGS